MTRKEARDKAKEINKKEWPNKVAEVVEDLIQKDYYVQIFTVGGTRTVL